METPDKLHSYSSGSSILPSSDYVGACTPTEEARQVPGAIWGQTLLGQSVDVSARPGQLIDGWRSESSQTTQLWDGFGEGRGERGSGRMVRSQTYDVLRRKNIGDKAMEEARVRFAGGCTRAFKPEASIPAREVYRDHRLASVHP